MRRYRPLVKGLSRSPSPSKRTVAHRIKLSPHREIVFPGPYYRPNVAFLRMTNMFISCVAFKVLSTAPERFTVDPPIGILAPNEELKIRILLHPNEANLDLATLEFCITSIPILSDEEDVDLEEIWREIDPDAILEQRLTCRFLNAPSDDESGEDDPPQPQFSGQSRPRKHKKNLDKQILTLQIDNEQHHKYCASLYNALQQGYTPSEPGASTRDVRGIESDEVDSSEEFASAHFPMTTSEWIQLIALAVGTSYFVYNFGYCFGWLMQWMWSMLRVFFRL